jgi:hypothetical protein
MPYFHREVLVFKLYSKALLDCKFSTNNPLFSSSLNNIDTVLVILLLMILLFQLHVPMTIVYAHLKIHRYVIMPMML